MPWNYVFIFKDTNAIPILKGKMLNISFTLFYWLILNIKKLRKKVKLKLNLTTDNFIHYTIYYLLGQKI